MLVDHRSRDMRRAFEQRELSFETRPPQQQHEDEIEASLGEGAPSEIDVPLGGRELGDRNRD